MQRAIDADQLSEDWVAESTLGKYLGFRRHRQKYSYEIWTGKLESTAWARISREVLKLSQGCRNL